MSEGTGNDLALIAAQVRVLEAQARFVDAQTEEIHRRIEREAAWSSPSQIDPLAGVAQRDLIEVDET